MKMLEGCRKTNFLRYGYVGCRSRICWVARSDSASQICERLPRWYVTNFGCRSCGLWSRGFVLAAVVLGAEVSGIWGWVGTVGVGGFWCWNERSGCSRRAAVLFPEISFAAYAKSGSVEIAAVHNNLFGAMSSLPRDQTFPVGSRKDRC